MARDEGAQGGFSIDIEPENGLIVMRAWGFWDPPLAERFGAEMMRAFASFRGRSWDILSDQRDYMPQTDEVQAVIGKLMASAPGMGMRRAANIASRTLDKIQIRRIARENRMENISFFQAEDEARAWIAEGHK